MAFYYLKLYHEMLHDPKVASLPDSTWRLFVECLLMASSTAERDGFLPPVNEMAWTLRRTSDGLHADLARLAQSELLELALDADGVERWFVTKFAERQAPVDAAERMRQMRERKKKALYYGDDTEPERDSYAPVTSRNTDIDIDKDKERENAHARVREESPTPSHKVKPNLLPENGKPPETTDQEGFAVMHVMDQWSTIVRRAIPREKADRVDDWFIPIRALLIQNGWDRGAAIRGMKAVREQMRAEGMTPYKPSAICHRVTNQDMGIRGTAVAAIELDDFLVFTDDMEVSA